MASIYFGESDSPRSDPDSGIIYSPIFATEPSNRLVERVRQELGDRYGLGRPLRKTELARLVGLSDDQGAAHIARLEKGSAVLSGPLEVVIRMLLAGHASPRHDQALATRYGRDH